MSTINDLPTELMLEVGQYLLLMDPHHCFLSYLSQTCRRFHNIFTHSIITYHTCSVLEGSEIIGVGSGQPNTAAFSLDGNFKEISFKLRRNTLNDTRCFRNLIFRANSISRIKIMVLRGASSQVLVCLLNSCVHRPGLHLKIEEDPDLGLAPFEGRPFLFNFSFNLQSDSTVFTPREMQPVKMAWKDILLGSLISSKRRKRNTSSQMKTTAIPRESHFKAPRPKVAPRLTGLWIEGDCLLSASIYPWTRYIMNAAPLTHLSITKSKLTIFDWSQILPSITISTLAYLAIGISVAFPDLLDFFHRHASLQEINLSGKEPIGVVSFLISTPSSRPNPLPKLKTLVATPDYIYPFIFHQQDGYFRDLNAYDIRPHYIYSDDAFHAIFELLATTNTHLSITLYWRPLNID